MASIGNNVIFSGFRGRFGDHFFRIRNGKTFICARPRITREPTEGMLKVRARFKQATAYAKTALEDPERRKFYEAARRPGRSAYNMAVADFLKEPLLKGLQDRGKGV